MTGSARFVLVYHRQPFEEYEENGEVRLRPHRSPNGIIPSLKGFCASLPDPSEAVWLAWSHVDTDEQAGTILGEATVEAQKETPLRVVRMGLTREQVSSFYHVTSKAALWPILHGFPGRFDYDAADWEAFREVNALFAKAVCQTAAPGATVWVHDYNLWLVPGLVKAQRRDLIVSFFHHTPFPPADIFGILPWREEILESLLQCHRVGFHVPRYADNFANCAESFCRAQPLRRQFVGKELAQVGSVLHQASYTSSLRYKDQICQLDAVPIGIDTALIQRTLRKKVSQQKVGEIRRELNVEKMIFSVGRVDYTKGTCEMLDAFERLLQREPQWHGRIKLCLTSVAPSRGMNVYEDIQDDIERRVGHINGHFSKLSWSPILLFTQPIDFETLVSWYCAADVCFITPLRDGLNLVAKEFVTCQSGRAGVLVLSEFTGAVIELDEAIHVNPYSSRSLDRGLSQALVMPREEAMQRLQAMEKRLMRYNIRHWTRKMMQLLRPGTPKDV